MIWDVRYTKSAEQDLQGIYDYIADVLLEPNIAERQIDRIIAATDSLEYMPLRHRLCDYEPWCSKGWRFLPVDKYLIFYFPNESLGTVTVMRIMYGGRDIEKNL